MHNIRPERTAPTWLVAILLLVSGGCALVFQVVWISELRLVFGATTASSAAVLAIFMAGLGLGNWLLGRRIDDSLRPLRFYGWLEAGIALTAGLSPLSIGLVRYVYVGVGGQSALGHELATVVRILASAAILAVPTLLMGGTMPAAARAVSVDTDVKRRGVALVYGLNTLGAVSGAGLANFLLLEAFGNRMVLWSACLINLLLAAAALRLSSRLSNAPVKLTERRNREPSTPTPTSIEQQPSQVGIVCFSAGIVGFVFFLMEIVWYRMLGPLLGGTTYTFGLILCVALLGIGVGGLLYSVLARYLKPSLQLLAATCAVEALFIAIPFWYGDHIAIWVLHQQSELITSFGEQVWNWCQVGAFVILPPSLVAGFQFPLLIAIAGAGRNNVGKHVGWTFAANTLGAISGSLAGGFFLLPMMTAPGVWRVAVCLLVLWGVGVSVLGNRWKNPMVALAGAVSILALGAVFSEGPTAVWRHSGIGAGRAELEGTGPNAEQNFMNAIRRQCIWEAEGVETSVAITATDSLAFVVNGKSDGNAYSDAGTQIGLGLIGPLLHKSPQNGLVIGLGTGESAGWLADTEGMNAVDVVELEPTVVQMAERCASLNRDALKNPKIRLHFNDAREFLLTSRKQYDLIVSEPSNPYRAGIANLYTREFYESASARLSSDGLFLQWLQGYEVDDSTVMIVLQTIRSVFPHMQIWRTKARDMVFVCGKSESALTYDAESIRRRQNKETIREGLNLAWRVDDVEGVAAHFVCGDRTIDQLLKNRGHLLNTDDRNLLEYAFAKTVGQATRFSVQDLCAVAIEARDDSPVPADHLNLETLAQRRLAMHLHLGGVVPLESHLSAAQRIRAEAYRAYLTKRFSDAATQFKRVDIDATCSIESLVYAHTLAEAGLPIPDHITKKLDDHSPTEAAAVRAIASFQQGQREQAIDDMLTTFKLLQSNPWASAQLIDAVLQRAVVISEVNVIAALRIYQQLDQPFAMYRLEDKRLLARYVVSENLENRYTVEALKALEPHIPWKGWLLENRARVYAAEQHPLARQASGDLRRFLQLEGTE